MKKPIIKYSKPKISVSASKKIPKATNKKYTF